MRNSEALNTHSSEELAEINPTDAKKLKVNDGERVEIASRRGKIKTRVRVTERVSAGMVFMTFYYKESPVNVLTNAACDKVAGTY